MASVSTVKQSPHHFIREVAMVCGEGLETPLRGWEREPTVATLAEQQSVFGRWMYIDGGTNHMVLPYGL